MTECFEFREVPGRLAGNEPADRERRTIRILTVFFATSASILFDAGVGRAQSAPHLHAGSDHCSLERIQTLNTSEWSNEQLRIDRETQVNCLSPGECHVTTSITIDDNPTEFSFAARIHSGSSIRVHGFSCTREVNPELGALEYDCVREEGTAAQQVTIAIARTVLLERSPIRATRADGRWFGNAFLRAHPRAWRAGVPRHPWICAGVDVDGPPRRARALRCRTAWNVPWRDVRVDGRPTQSLSVADGGGYSLQTDECWTVEVGASEHYRNTLWGPSFGIGVSGSGRPIFESSFEVGSALHRMMILHAGVDLEVGGRQTAWFGGGINALVFDAVQATPSLLLAGDVGMRFDSPVPFLRARLGLDWGQWGIGAFVDWQPGQAGSPFFTTMTTATF